MVRHVCSGAALLLLLLAAASFEAVHAKSKQEREDALDAGMPMKAKRGAAGQLQKGPKAGRSKSEVFAECFNMFQENMGKLPCQRLQVPEVCQMAPLGAAPMKAQLLH